MQQMQNSTDQKSFFPSTWRLRVKESKQIWLWSFTYFERETFLLYGTGIPILSSIFLKKILRFSHDNNWLFSALLQMSGNCRHICFSYFERCEFRSNRANRIIILTAPHQKDISTLWRSMKKCKQTLLGEKKIGSGRGERTQKKTFQWNEFKMHF